MRALILMVALATATAQAAHAEENRGLKIMRELGMALDDETLAKRVAEAERHPLGSKENPVRVSMPSGEHAYLARLRCADNSAPAFSRGGSVGRGPYGYILDVYDVTCSGQASIQVYMDMYHEQAERRPISGFTIAE